MDGLRVVRSVAKRLNQRLTVLVLATCSRALLRGDLWFPLAVPSGLGVPALCFSARFVHNG